MGLRNDDENIRVVNALLQRMIIRKKFKNVSELRTAFVDLQVLVRGKLSKYSGVATGKLYGIDLLNAIKLFTKTGSVHRCEAVTREMLSKNPKLQKTLLDLGTPSFKKRVKSGLSKDSLRKLRQKHIDDCIALAVRGNYTDDHIRGAFLRALSITEEKTKSGFAGVYYPLGFKKRFRIELERTG